MTGQPSARDDAALVAAALNGERHAFTDLMRRHKEPIYRFIRRYVGDADEAYDLLQETFVAAWSALATFNAAKPMRAWLRRIALNKCRDWSRRRKVRQFFFAAKPIDTAANMTAPPLDVELQTSERKLDALDHQIALLPANLKEPFILTQLEGLSHKDAARTLNLSSKAIEMRIYRARALLAAALRLVSEDDEGSS